MDHTPYQSQLEDLKSKLSNARALLADPEMAPLAEAEITTLEAQLKTLEQAAADYQAAITQSESSGSTDTRTNCTLEFRPGAGGDEAKIWANDLLRMYARFAEMHGLKITYIDDLVIKVAGKTADLTEIHPEDATQISAYELLQYESGVHRVQRVPETESQGRIHTSTASVAVLPEVPHNAVEIRDEDLEWQFMRASGAGGQSVNKTNSAVRLVHTPTGITTTSRQEKQQEQNRKIALDLLRSQLWEIEEEKRLQELGDARSAIGRGKRSEKIRTYNYPQNRVTDHRTKQSWYNLPTLLDGGIDTLIIELHQALLEEEQEATSDPESPPA